MPVKERRPHEGSGDQDTDRAVDTAKSNLLAAALEYAAHHWEVFPLRGKVPAIPKDLGGHGVLDATSVTGQIITWWNRYPDANIGGRVPASMIVIDIDPYHGGEDTVASWAAEFGELPETYMHISGRGDGGRHLFFRRPSGKLNAKRLTKTGVDLRTHGNYTVLPPSIHPDTGRPYTMIEAPVADPPTWLIRLLRPETPHRITPPNRCSSLRSHLGGSVADSFSENASWAEILVPHGWRCLDADPDADGAVWLRPGARSACSATVRHGCLFVYSTETDFDETVAGDPHGYTRFRAWALLNFNGDMTRAARALKGGAA